MSEEAKGEYVPVKRYRIVVSGIVDARTPQAAQEKFKLATGLRALILRPSTRDVDEYSVSTIEIGVR
jgi:hypothetical protein